MHNLIMVSIGIVPTVILSLWWVFRPAKVEPVNGAEDVAEILLRDGVIEHASEAAIRLLPIAIGSQTWEDLFQILHPNFPLFPAQPNRANSPDTLVYGTQSEINHIRIIWRSTSTSLIFLPATEMSRNAAEIAELATLREISELSPHPAWKTDDAGMVVWNNEAYKILSERLPKFARQPAEPIFDLPSFNGSSSKNRVKIEVTDASFPEWFNVVRTPLPTGILHQATSLTEVIKAENAQRDFVQTLAKTFAHLSIGLAIFNRDRQLALFNPALVDLTGLPISFLGPRPTIDTFFDALRENRRMPEPKNYNTWRHRIAHLISEAETGRFEETWTLETGQTYNVKGRPHPDGAIAFLIEDISAEVSLTRNFRAELEMGQSLADTFEDALAVFSQAGVLTFSNKAYDVLWGFQFDTSFADITIADAVKMWKEKSAPNPLWQELLDSVMSLKPQREWEMPISMKGKCPMNCKIVPIASGATVVRFSRKRTLAANRAPLTSSITEG
ncbi:MAG: PAS-domain containing protein [Sulfitobacter sp.]